MSTAHAVAVPLASLERQPFELLLQFETQLRESGEQEARGRNAWTGLACRIGEYRFLVPREDVREVITSPRTTRVPGARAWLTGIANVRGALMPLVDLAAMFKLERAEADAARNWTLIFNSDQIPAGILVDEVFGYREFGVSDQRHELLERMEPALAACLLGVFVRDGETWPVLSLHRLSASPMFISADVGHVVHEVA